MSKEGDRAAVFRTTKVRTAIKGDSSWIQRQREAEVEEEEKPWIAEVRANRVNGAPKETSPVSSPIRQTPAPTDATLSTKAPASGYLIRGVFTKTDSKPASSTSSNGYSAPTSTFTKKPSEGYKKIAPHTVRTTSEAAIQSDPQLSPEEVEKRTEAASGVLKAKAARQRSYVLSAAKKYETNDQPQSPLEKSPVNSTFTARRVVITDDDEEEAEDTPAVPADTLKEPTPPAPVTVPEPAPVVTQATLPTPEPTSAPAPITAPVASPTPEPAPAAVQEPAQALKTARATTPECTPALSTPPASPPPSPASPPLVPVSPPASPVPPPALLPLSPTTAPSLPAPPVAEPHVTTKASTEVNMDSTVSPVDKDVMPLATVQDTALEVPVPQNPDTLTALSDTLISFDTTYTRNTTHSETVEIKTLDSCIEPDDVPDLRADLHKNDLIALAKSNESDREESLDIPEPVSARDNTEPEMVVTKTLDSSIEPDDLPELSPDLHNDDLIALAKSGEEEFVDPTPSSPPAWRKDLLSGPESTPAKPEKTTAALDLLADDIIPIDTSTSSLSTDDVTRNGYDNEEQLVISQSPTETVITTKTTIITTEDSTTDLFDPFPKESNSVKSPVELFDPLSPDPTTGVPNSALVSLADDIIPIDTNTRLVTDRSWGHLETPNSHKSEKDPAGDDDEQRTVSVRFETRSSDNDSPWDRWTSPTVYTTTTTEESTLDTDDQESTSSDPEAKKGLVLLKEYVDVSNGLNSKPGLENSDMSECTYCGELVGSDAKITIEHLNISCHPECFKCGICSKPMGDLLFSMFLHNGMVHCETCYANVI